MIPARLVLATGNLGKQAELRALLHEWGRVEVRGLDEFPSVTMPPEVGGTYAENAVAKAQAVAAGTGLPALGDDSGLEVDALGGAPGLYSARYAGPGDVQRVARLLAELRAVAAPRRTARFVCVVALAWPGGGVVSAEGECRGRIACTPSGDGGFGYDPVFVPDELGWSFAAASPGEKQRLSHRARAVLALGRRLAAT